MNNPSTVWTDSILAHLDILAQTCGHCPRGEYLTAASANRILDKFDEARGKFLFIMELHGFTTKPSASGTHPQA